MELIYRSIRGFNNTCIYLYCVDKQSVIVNRNIFQQRGLYKIFTNDRLIFHLSAAQMELLYDLALEAPGESVERDEWAIMAIGQVNRLKDLFQQHVNMQLGC